MNRLTHYARAARRDYHKRHDEELEAAHELGFGLVLKEAMNAVARHKLNGEEASIITSEDGLETATIMYCKNAQIILFCSNDDSINGDGSRHTDWWKRSLKPCEARGILEKTITKVLHRRCLERSIFEGGVIQHDLAL